MEFTGMGIIAIYLGAINLIAFAAYGIDKRKAAHDKWRTPERKLIMLAVLGGGVGAWAGMSLFRHKTKHTKFRVLVPLFTILWIAALAACGWYYYLYR